MKKKQKFYSNDIICRKNKKRLWKERMIIYIFYIYSNRYSNTVEFLVSLVSKDLLFKHSIIKYSIIQKFYYPNKI